MRIALCLSGQPRTWKKCYEGWYSAFKSQNAKIDLFFHLWDYNTLPKQVATNNVNNIAISLDDVLLNEYEKVDIINTLKPVSYKFESKWETPKEFYQVDNIIARWAIGQFNSLRKVASLKRDFEIEHNFQYDLAVRIRSDLVFNSEVMIESIIPNTIYATHIGWDKSWDCFRISDIFFWGNSYTFDQAADFYYHQSIIDAADIIKGDNLVYPPELAFYHYLKSVGINVRPTWPDLKIKRSDEYLKVKGRLDAYEIL